MKIRSIITLISLFVLASFATTNAQNVFNGGLVGGLGISEISGDKVWGPNKPGVFIGAFVNTEISQKSSFQMEMSYVQKGSRKSPNYITQDYSTYKLNLHYVELFFHYRYKYKPRLKIEAGFSTGVLASNYEEYNGNEVDDHRDWSRIDLSGNFGLIFEYDKNLSFLARYSNSLLPVRPHLSGQVYRLNRGEYNEVLSFGVLYTIKENI